MTAEQFRTALKTLKLRQVWLAEQLGVQPTTVNRWAKGRIAVPQHVAFVMQLLAERKEPDDRAQVAAFAEGLVRILRSEVEAFKATD